GPAANSPTTPAPATSAAPTTPAPSAPATGPPTDPGGGAPPPVPGGDPAGVPAFPPSLAGQDLERIPTNRSVVALTFDAGANADAVPSILATLATEGVPATFFLTGDFVRDFPTACQSIVAAGHRVGNHSASHPHFTALTGSQIRTEVGSAEQDIRACGADPRPLFRFPFGDRDSRTIAAVNDLGYLAVRWTVDTLGWQGTSGGRSAAEATQRVLHTARPGQDVL